MNWKTLLCYTENMHFEIEELSSVFHDVPTSDVVHDIVEKKLSQFVRLERLSACFKMFTERGRKGNLAFK